MGLYVEGQSGPRGEGPRGHGGARSGEKHGGLSRRSAAFTPSWGLCERDSLEGSEQRSHCCSGGEGLPRRRWPAGRVSSDPCWWYGERASLDFSCASYRAIDCIICIQDKPYFFCCTKTQKRDSLSCRKCVAV